MKMLNITEISNKRKLFCNLTNIMVGNLLLRKKLGKYYKTVLKSFILKIIKGK